MEKKKQIRPERISTEIYVRLRKLAEAYARLREVMWGYVEATWGNPRLRDLTRGYVTQTDFKMR